MSIESLRREIDRLDDQIVRLLHERARSVTRIAAKKRRHGLAIFDPAREEAILARVAGQAEQPWDGGSLARVYGTVLTECRRIAQRAAQDEGDG